MNDPSEETEHTAGSSSDELDSTDGWGRGGVEYERLLIHFRRGGVRGPHPDAVFQPIAEVFVDLNPRVRRGTWQRKTMRRIRLKRAELPHLHLWKNGRAFQIFGAKTLVCSLCESVPSEKISQRRTPNDQTSLWLVYTLSKMLSGAIHFRGRRACTKTHQ